ncbi:Hypothetical_protein [Hexamita inflata]|uniref:Hypothetical_protein n=1 Tax=Hexamita inflata TaxID=28002 RepID=A0AA86VS34_9EUKA|nr:Hypothetical protein HINF_LOCUS62943 [Hexamita inflata]
MPANLTIRLLYQVFQLVSKIKMLMGYVSVLRISIYGQIYNKDSKLLENIMEEYYSQSDRLDLNVTLCQFNCFQMQQFELLVVHKQYQTDLVLTLEQHTK